MALSEIKRRDLISKAKLIFYGLPVGLNAPHDTPIIGNQTLAQVTVNRVNSITKNPEEFKYMVDVITQMLKETKGKEVEKVTLPKPVKGLTDARGRLLRKPNSK